jgi:hypothetical protein
MNRPALALTPVPTGTGTGAGANTALTRQQDHRHHTLCENTDGKQEDPGRGRLTARHGLGAPPFPLLPGPGSHIGSARGRA